MTTEVAEKGSRLEGPAQAGHWDWDWGNFGPEADPREFASTGSGHGVQPEVKVRNRDLDVAMA